MSILTKILQHQMAQISRSLPEYPALMTKVVVPFLALSALASEPIFEEVLCADNPLKPPICGGNFRQASFIDLDNDNDLDAMIGLTTGTIAYFENVGNAKAAVFEQRFDTGNLLKEVNVKYNTSISLVDLDNDGDLDAVIGNGDGEISYYENVGHASLPQFEQRTKHPLNEVNLGFHPYLSIVDLDNDRDLDVVIGHRDGKTSYYENVGNASQPQFKPDTKHPLTSISGISPSLVDLDNDGDLDVVIGHENSEISYYENVNNISQPQFEPRTEHPLSGFDLGGTPDIVNSVFPNLVDLDNDGDLDLFIGNYYGQVRYYENVGNASQAQFERRINPLGGLDVGLSASPNLVDLDNDGDWDAIIGNLDGKLSYYENVGSTNLPQFEQRVEHALREIDVVSNASPSLADLDNDGDLDVVIGNEDGKISYYENVGSASQPVFEPCVTLTESRKDQVSYYENVDNANQSPQFNKQCTNPLSGVNASSSWKNASPNLVDLDNDSDWDIVIGNSNGKLNYYENVGSANQPQFQPRIVHSLSEVDVVRDASPFLIDLDNDGDWDALIGDGNWDGAGKLSYYENVGSAGQPRFEKRIEHSLDKVEVGFQASPSLVDLDNDGDLDAVIGHLNGQMVYYENVGNVNQLQFEPLEYLLNGIDLGYDGFPSLADLDNDGDLDTVIGNNKGQVRYYENVGNANQPVFEECSGTSTLFCGVDVGKSAIPNLVDLDNDGDWDAIIGNEDGKISYYENVGNAKQPQFEQRAEHPLNGVDVNQDASPSLGDLDNDDDLDAVIGNRYGQLNYYKNVGSASQPQFEQRLDHPLNGLNVNDDNVNDDYKPALPSLADLDNDGDLDVVIGGDSFCNLSYYENVGDDDSQPIFERRTGHPLSKVSEAGDSFVYPSLVDLDNDSDLDAVIGNFDGKLSYYKNVGSSGQPQFEQYTNPFGRVNVGWGAFPSLVDLDKDDDLDVVIGNSEGKVKYYENVGNNASQPRFEKCRNSSNPFCEVNLEGDTYPRLADLDNDGDWDAVIGNDGQLSYYENMGNASRPQFELRIDHPLSWKREERGNHIAPSLADLDNDDDWDVVVGNTNKISYYENVGSTSQPQFEQRLAHPLDRVKVEYDAYPNLVDLDNDGDLDAVIGDGSDVHYYENVGSVSQPVFEERPDHPLNQVKVDEYPAYPSLVDLDNDGDKDAFIGNNYYINTGSNVLPPNRALPKGGLYSKPREVNLVCLDCETIYYTLDGTTPTTESLVFTEPFNLAESTTLKFLTVDAKGQQSKIMTEKYVFDTVPPQITITLPTDRRTMVEIADIRGTADDLGGSGLRRIELNIFSAPMSLQGNHRADFNEEIQWLPVKYKKNWFYDLSAVSFPVGTYEITARVVDNAGNMSTDTITLFRATQARTDLFLKLDSATLLGGKHLNATGTLVSRRFPAIEEDLKGQEIQLLITAPDGTTWTETTQIQSNIGQFEFKGLSGFDQEGAYHFVAQFAETDLLTQADSEAQSVLVGQSAGYAVIVMGQIANGEGLEAHNKTTNRIYKTLKERGFEDENIFYFNPTPNQQICKEQNGQQQCTPIGIDGQPTVVDFVSQVEGLAERLNGSPAPFYLILVNHGDQEGNFYIHDPDLEYVMPEMWGDWLDALEAELNEKARAKPRFVLLGYCYSGKTLETLSAPGRIVISSAADNEVSYKGPKEPDGIRAGEYFMEEFFGHLGRGESFYTAFQNATARTELFTRRGGRSTNVMNRFNDQAVQHPLLALDGHEGYNDLGAILLQSTKEVRQADKEEVAEPLDLNELYLGVGADYDTNYVGNPAAIDSVTETLYLEPDETSAELFLMVNNAARVKEAAVNVRLPSIQLTSESEQSQNPVQQVEIQALEEINLLCDFDNRCDRQTDEVIPNLFTEPGKYELYYFVADNETQDISKIWRSVVYKNYEGNQSPTPVELLTPADGSEEQATTLLFSWEATTDSDGLTYTLVIAEDAEFNEVVYRQEELTKTQLLVSSSATALRNGTPLELEDATEYYWKVEAVDNFGAKTASQVRWFQTNYTNCRVMTPSGTIRPGFDGSCPNGSLLTTLPFPPYCPNTYVCR